MAELQDVSVKVPTDRLAEFYEWFGRWMRQPPASDPGASPLTPEPGNWDPETDHDIAAEAWPAFPRRAQLMLSTLIDNPDRHFTGDELAELHEIPHGKYGIAGTLAWPSRQLSKLGRRLPIEVEQSPRGSHYWMTPSMAGLWAGARPSA